MQNFELAAAYVHDQIYHKDIVAAVRRRPQAFTDRTVFGFLVQRPEFDVAEG
jgi:hypothetical protein